MGPKEKNTFLSLDLIVLCDYALVSQENKLSVIGIFDQIFVQDFPANHSRMFAVAVLKGKPDANYEVSMKILNPSGKEILHSPSLKNVLGPSGRSNVIVGLENIPLSVSGEYLIEISSSGAKLGEMKFGVFRARGRNDIKTGAVSN